MDRIMSVSKWMQVVEYGRGPFLLERIEEYRVPLLFFGLSTAAHSFQMMTFNPQHAFPLLLL